MVAVRMMNKIILAIPNNKQKKIIFFLITILWFSNLGQSQNSYEVDTASLVKQVSSITKKMGILNFSYSEITIDSIKQRFNYDTIYIELILSRRINDYFTYFINMFSLGDSIYLHGKILINQTTKINSYTYDYSIRKNKIEGPFTEKTNGILTNCIYYRNNSKNGPSFHFFNNGLIADYCEFNNGKLHGKYFVFYENGGVKRSGEFKSGLEFGNRIEYFANGDVKCNSHISKKYYYVVKGNVYDRKGNLVNIKKLNKNIYNEIILESNDNFYYKKTGVNMVFIKVY
jgi:antitoxin component YwqK of YwqJK toxin-antitoxin module